MKYSRRIMTASGRVRLKIKRNKLHIIIEILNDFSTLYIFCFITKTFSIVLL